MEGYILILSNNDRREITKANFNLFGRISKVKERYYYYEGVLHNVPYIRLSDGCIFVEKNIDINKLKGWTVFPADVSLGEIWSHNQTAYKKWKTFATTKNLTVKNL
jgi:hypothetical protein